MPISIGATVQISTITITGQSAEGLAPTDTTPTTFADPGAGGSFVEPSPSYVPPPSSSFDVPPLDA